MHLPTLLVTLTAALTSATPLSNLIVESPHPLSKRECFGSGETWGNSKQTALDAADYACLSSLGKPTVYNGNEQKQVCINIGNNLKVNLNIKRIKGSARELGYSECLDGLRKEINGCARGGRTGYENWEYTADPNTGSC